MSLWKKWLERSRGTIISLLFPPRCPVCDEILAPEEIEKGIHLACESKLFPVEGAVCMHCGRPLGPVKSQQEHINSENRTALFRYLKQDNLTESAPFRHLKRESIAEYCNECHRKGYVPVSIYENLNYKRKLSYDMQYNEVEHTMSRSNITQAKSLYLYKGTIKNVMYRLKYANKREYACFFAKRAVEKYGEWLGVTNNEIHSAPNAKQKSSTSLPQVIIPVPMYRKKQKLRGYNQAEAFAEELSKLTGIPVDRDCIKRVKDTAPQKELNDIERKNNLENAFQTGESIVQYRHILVVDDIYTTGYTAEAVAKELKKQGGHHIYLLSVCIGGNEY